MKQFQAVVLAGCSALVLTGCGADDVVAPGGSIIINPAPTPTPSTGVPGGSVTAAAASSCTPGTTDGGTIALQNNRGTIRNCVIQGPVITGTLTLSGRRADGIMYSLNGRTEVGRDVDLANGAAATFNVLPGVTVFAATKESTLIVNRGSRINADGTQAQPIIFTALANLTGAGITEKSDNLWGGLIINGRAPISDCDPLFSTSNVGGTLGCSRNAEGLSTPALYGGNVANDNSGVLRYVQVNFTGVGVNASEIQGITTGGVGSGTVMSYIQIHNSLDDGIEIFGGTQNLDHLVLTGIADDSFDTDFGYTGSTQFLFAARRAAGNPGDSVTNQTMFEIDSTAAPDASPRQYLKVANFTLLQNTPGETAIRLRGGADADFANGIVVARSTGTVGCLDVDNAETVRTAGTYNGTPDRGLPRFFSVVFDCDTLVDPDGDTFEETVLNNAENTNVNRAFTNTLQFLTGSSVGRVANGANETAVVATPSLGSISAFFQQVNYIGAFSGPNDNWTRDWTCNSDVADLRGALGCIDIRVF